MCISHTLRSSSSTTGTSSGSATVAMLFQYDFSFIKQVQVKIRDMSGRIGRNRQVQHLIKITVIQVSIPTHRYSIPAHHSSSCLWIKGISQLLHISFIISTLKQ